MRKLLSVLLILPLLGCSTVPPESAEHLALEVNSKIKNQMLFSQAEAALIKLDFSCHEGTSINPNLKNIYECSRSRSSLLYSCIHKVFFEAMSTESAISNLVIDAPNCAGL